MGGGLWKARLESALANAGRDISDMYRQMTAYIGNLSATERLVLLGLAMIGLFYLLFSHLSRRRNGDSPEGRFAGILFIMVALAALAGWMMSGGNTA
jgi:hypothetical protein